MWFMCNCWGVNGRPVRRNRPAPATSEEACGSFFCWGRRVVSGGGGNIAMMEQSLSGSGKVDATRVLNDGSGHNAIPGPSSTEGGDLCGVSEGGVGSWG